VGFLALLLQKLLLREKQNPFISLSGPTLRRRWRRSVATAPATLPPSAVHPDYHAVRPLTIGDVEVEHPRPEARHLRVREIVAAGHTGIVLTGLWRGNSAAASADRAHCRSAG
jgi:hypothetical protein